MYSALAEACKESIATEEQIVKKDIKEGNRYGKREFEKSPPEGRHGTKRSCRVSGDYS